MASHGDAFCIRSVKPQWVQPANVPQTENFDFGEALSQVEPLLDLIFRYLPTRDLKSCLKVSPSWKERAEGALGRRNAPSWCTCYRVTSKGHKSNVIQHSPNLNYNNIQLGIFIYDSCRWKLTKCVCVHSNISELSRKYVPEYLEEELVPGEVEYCLLSVNRVVSYFGGTRTTEDIQTHGSIFEGVLIPKIPSVRTVLFHCNPTCKKGELKNTISKYVGENDEAKCILIFLKTQLYEPVSNLLEFLVPKGQPSPVALGGGIIRGTKTFQHVSTDPKVIPAKDAVCIAFLKDKTSDLDNFRAYSRVLKKGSYGDDMSKEELEAELLEFKRLVILKKHSLGFRFSCVENYQRNELESFKAVFPGLPLLGSEVRGEIGWNSCTNEPEEDQPGKHKRKRRKKDHPVPQHFYSTIFVLVTWD
ncbi:uncharacterized protein LOC126747503 [Anthonomus grandis grandis]|uniref:uncharacterized protein LOC126747503 n=1 Tax=Anthonomus grandis grandis TaxID=2921223 RepID=UPI002164F6FC|nr:uncharacterized protein LOC126747503 [Anthonomus grandis grandis]XP_050312149.1 uncharacterized protein LOC126747503 [Anthonomus grandis grandis]